MALNTQPKNKLGVISRAFKDISFNFTQNFVTGDVNVLKNEEAIKQSVKNLILTKYRERLFNPFVGCNATAYLFEIANESDGQGIINEIEYILKTFEQRIELQRVEVFTDIDRNEYIIEISYFIVGEPILQTTQVVLVREM
jgi:phage baseplate assembly protein W